MKSLATACLLYCGSCRFYMNRDCQGCESPVKPTCTIRNCCRERGLTFCAECVDFPCETIRSFRGIHPKWLEKLGNCLFTGSLYESIKKRV